MKFELLSAKRRSRAFAPPTHTSLHTGGRAVSLVPGVAAGRNGHRSHRQQSHRGPDPRRIAMMHALQYAGIGTPIEFELGDRLPPGQMVRYYDGEVLPFGLFVPSKRAAGGAPVPSDAADPAATSAFMTMDSAAIIEDADPEDTCSGIVVGGGKDSKDGKDGKHARS